MEPLIQRTRCQGRSRQHQRHFTSLAVSLCLALAICIYSSSVSFSLLPAARSSSRVYRRAAEGGDYESTPPMRATSWGDGGFISRVVEEEAGIELDGFLEEALLKAGLLDRAQDIKRWCEEQGAVQLQEIMEELNSLGEDLGLEASEVSKLGNAILETVEEEHQKRKQQEENTRQEMARLGQQFLNGKVSKEAATKTFEQVMERTGKS
eukprot:TRINITY_DN4441_c0_g2_i1.p1 TRINITY_DN4441_c0_g2~~TRINITY_DN4441_c0_g2_i1.p1  ORF type:complete len:208 (+),score=50.38 TRINITY_DN4441_c0_g2_i1:71-694(+)